MTKKLYYAGNTLREAEAEVLACEALEGGGFRVLTDVSVIFPEGGGQPSDRGSLGGAPVFEAREDGEDIWLYTDRAFAAGTRVRMDFDVPRRLDHSRQHTGEHIISGLAKRLYGASNVGFHMAESYSTLDLDMPLDDAQMRALERAANEAVQANLPTRCEYVDASALAGMELRKQAKGLTGEVRIVYIGDVDSCTCCGTHCASAGEVGYIQFVNYQHYKGGVRLWFLCGMRAVEAACAQRDTLEALARRYSTKREEVQGAVEKQISEIAALKNELKNKTAALMDFRAADALAKAPDTGGTKLVILRLPDTPMGDLKLLADRLVSGGRCVALLFGENGETLHYQLAASKGAGLSMREVCAALNAMTGGKGGGRDDFAQGSAKKQSGFAETLEQLEHYMLRRMGEKA